MSEAMRDEHLWQVRGWTRLFPALVFLVLTQSGGATSFLQDVLMERLTAPGSTLAGTLEHHLSPAVCVPVSPVKQTWLFQTCWCECVCL